MCVCVHVRIYSCVWQSKLDGAPNCTFPPGYGYALSESPTALTDAGFTARLHRIANPSLFGDDVISLIVNVTFETDHRVRIKVTEYSAVFDFVLLKVAPRIIIIIII